MTVTVVGFLALLFADKARFSFYLVHLFPLYWTLCAVAAYYLYSSRRRVGLAIIAALCLVVPMEAGIIVYKSGDYEHKLQYEEMVDAVRSYPAARQALIMGPTQFIFDLRPGYEINDDGRFGFYTGKRPDLIIRTVDSPVASTYAEQEPKFMNYLNDLLQNRVELIFRNREYFFYRVKPAGK
jgi:hypothetical protein